MLKIANALKDFHGHRVLEGVSLEVQPNRIVGLAGPSGGGKSTLLRCIQGLDTLDAGQIICSGRPGFIFQDFQLFPHMTVLANVTYALEKVGRNANARELGLSLLKQLGLREKTDRFPHQLSGGQKQRVALARTLAIHPDLLLCDEPTSGLDVSSIQDVIDLLRSVHKMGVTMLIASHDLDFLTQMSDRLLVLKKGKIVADLIPSEFSDQREYLKSLYRE
ncbi:amino acid ABC transporter ATP-binding protein [Pajaroellobacter abortibovis]|uniref:Amino acid ABC transporter ATP-binding protein n=1 Tax=Pajaroellobacter abortibovis TaxID=1882918 RepID=A0A1L6MXY4_9BACT|nr:ATP-binding cassette domain-containing protein [Pajaroellobacter abortibovis]APS00359.1 amino acid ABC transporter ATP-binding protein [Pajaroellobacter abortibovis]